MLDLPIVFVGGSIQGMHLSEFSFLARNKSHAIFLNFQLLIFEYENITLEME
jgi:hypothetical protein